MKKSNTKELILEKAIDLFSEHGYAAASIRDIVKAVGVSVSTVYIHFKDKDEILYTIINEIGTFFLNVLQDATRGIDDPVERLRKMIFTQVCLIKEKRKEIEIYTEEQFQLSQELSRKVHKQHRKIYDLYYDTLGEIRERGLLMEANQTVMTFSIFAMMNWAHRWYNEQGPLTIEEIAEDIIRIFFSGILKDSSSPTRR